MSPEQWMALEFDARTDLYAIGVTLYEMATRQVPFTGQSIGEVKNRALLQDVPPPSLYDADIDARLEAIITKCLAKEPSGRFAGARELRTELRAIIEPVDGASRLQRRRELIEASLLTPLEETESGFTEFFVALSSAVMRTGYYEKAHKEAATALARLATSIDAVLKNRGELSLVRRDVAEMVVLTVLTAAGDVNDLKKLLPGSVYELHAHKFGEVFARRSVVSLVLRDGVDEEELTDLIELLSGPEIPVEALRQRFLTRGFTYVSVLFSTDLLGRKRKLPWQVDLCISRLARDLEALPMVRGMDEEQRRVLRTQLAGDVVRPLGKPDQLRSLLDNADLIAAALSDTQHVSAAEISKVIVDACSLRTATVLARHLLEAMDSASRPQNAWSLVQPEHVDPSEHLKLLAARFSRDRASESDAVLRQLYDKSFLKLPDLPADLRMWMTAEAHANELGLFPDRALATLDGIVDPDAYEQELPIFEFVIRVLSRRAEVRTLVLLLDLFKRHVEDKGRHRRIRQCAAATALALEEPEVLTNIARALLGESLDAREAAQRLLAAAGAKSAAPLIGARLQLSGSDAALRARFVATFREIGVPGLSALIEALRPLGPEADPLLVEDFLRALPDTPDEAGGHVVERFAAHPAPGVRRAAASALPALWGAAARPVLLRLLAGQDDGARLGALAGLRRINAIDGEVVSCIGRILGAGADSGEEIRAACAASLAHVPPELCASSLEILSGVVRVARKSFVGLLKEAIESRRESTIVLVTSSRSLLQLGGRREREMVRERAANSSGLLKKQLETLLATGH
jgi:hypothetical protein